MNNVKLNADVDAVNFCCDCGNVERISQEEMDEGRINVFYRAYVRGWRDGEEYHRNAKKEKQMIPASNLTNDWYLGPRPVEIHTLKDFLGKVEGLTYSCRIIDESGNPIKIQIGSEPGTIVWLQDKENSYNEEGEEEEKYE